MKALEDASGEFILANPQTDIFNPDAVTGAVGSVREATNDGQQDAPADAFPSGGGGLLSGDNLDGNLIDQLLDSDRPTLPR